LAIFIGMKKNLYSLYDPVCDLLLIRKVLRSVEVCFKVADKDFVYFCFVIFCNNKELS
jgi:hypothetical protein